MPAHETLSLWESFYVIVGSSAGALTGLQFVVMALMQESSREGGEHEVNTFATPTIVHFCFVLLVAATLSAPWPQMLQVATALWFYGAAGIVYTLIVMRRARRSKLYQPVVEDWVWYCWLPLTSYVVMLAGAGILLRYSTVGLFGIAAAAILLMFVGIHNAWDSATYIALAARNERQSSSPAPPVIPQ
jgi:hypothetical protein